jgi:oligoribonuclease NrnB/cAMP/cGMP phosphodiesterase (DHH superfamily)
MIGIYHNCDLDGFCSGAIIKKKYPEAKMVGHDYGIEFDFDRIDGPVIMADISLPMKDMVELASKSGWKLTWIDHHISAIKDYSEYTKDSESFCIAVLEDGIAACEGTWKYLFPDQDMPLSVKLLGEYDTWRNGDKVKWEDEILPFQYGMRLRCNSVDTFPSYILESDDHVWDVIEEGKTVIRYQSQTSELQCKTAAFETEFEGLRAICLNGGGFNSNAFESVYNESKHDLMIPFQWKKDKWVVSLYTTKDEVDCSVLAKSKGGGGHKKAAGFQVSDISFLIK